MNDPRQSEKADRLLENLAVQLARNRTNSAKWDLNILIILFSVLVTVIILISFNIDNRIVALIAVVGLAFVWLIGRGRGERLFQHFYSEELANLQQDDAVETPAGMEQLTAREKEVLFFVARGYANKLIATELGISINTVKIFMSRILVKLNAKDRTEAVVIAIKYKILSLE